MTDTAVPDSEPGSEPGIASELPSDVVEAIRAFTTPAAALITGDMADRLAAFFTTLLHDAYGRGFKDGLAAQPVAVGNGFTPARFPHLNGALRHGAIGQG